MNYEPMSLEDCRNERELKARYHKIHKKFFDRATEIRSKATADTAEFSRLKELIEHQLNEMQRLIDMSDGYQGQIEKLTQIVKAKRASVTILRDVVESMGVVDIYTFDCQRIINTVAEVYGLRVSDVKGPSRCKREVNARRHVIHLLTEYRPDLSLPLIGKLLGGKDHTTVLHARNSWARWAPKYEAQILAVNEKLGIGKPVDTGDNPYLSQTDSPCSDNISISG